MAWRKMEREGWRWQWGGNECIIPKGLHCRLRSGPHMVSKSVCRQNRHWLITLIHTRKPDSLLGISAAGAKKKKERKFTSKNPSLCVCDTLYRPPSPPFSLPASIHPPISLWLTVGCVWVATDHGPRIYPIMNDCFLLSGPHRNPLQH